MILPTYDIRERQVLTCPLGVRFVDDATGRSIGGLRVEAYRPVERWPYKRRRRGGLLRPEIQCTAAVPTRSDIYGFHGLPGLRDFEKSTDDESRWILESPLSPRPFVVEVEDPERRFLPARFVAEAPARVELRESESPPRQATVRTEKLYSSPSRLAPGGCAALRAQLFELDGRGGRQKPAAWAVAEISPPSTTVQSPRSARLMTRDGSRSSSHIRNQ